MSDNAPTVITAAEFVSGGYAQRVAAGECVVYALTFKVQDVSTEANGYLIQWVPVNDNDYDPYDYFQADNVPHLNVEWTATATAATDELASLRAQVARYRVALGGIAEYASTLSDLTSGTLPSSDFTRLADMANAALAETEQKESSYQMGVDWEHNHE